MEVRNEMEKEVRWLDGKARCQIEVRYRKGAKIRNVGVRFLEDYKWWKKGDRTVTPVRRLWRRPRK